MIFCCGVQSRPENAQDTKKPKKAVPAAENTAEKEKSSAQMREELTTAYQNGGMSEAEFDDALDAIYEQELKEGIHPGDEFITGRYSISSTLKDDLQSVMDGKFKSKNNEVYIGETSNFLVDEIEADSLSVTMPATKAYSSMATEDEARTAGRLRDNLNYHGLGVDGLYKALEASEKPVAVFVARDTDERSRGDRLVLVTDYVKDGSPVVVVQNFNTKGVINGQILSVNKDITAFDKQSLQYDILDAFNDGTLLYLDKKRSQKLLAGMPGANSLGFIRTSDFKNNISNFWGGVKWLNDNVTNLQQTESRASISRTAEDKSAVMDQLRSFLDGKIS